MKRRAQRSAVRPRDENGEPHALRTHLRASQLGLGRPYRRLPPRRSRRSQDPTSMARRYATTHSLRAVALPQSRGFLRKHLGDILRNVLTPPLPFRDLRDRPVVAETLLGPDQVVV